MLFSNSNSIDHHLNQFDRLQVKLQQGQLHLQAPTDKAIAKQTKKKKRKREEEEEAAKEDFISSHLIEAGLERNSFFSSSTSKFMLML